MLNYRLHLIGCVKFKLQTKIKDSEDTTTTKWQDSTQREASIYIKNLVTPQANHKNHRTARYHKKPINE